MTNNGWYALKTRPSQKKIQSAAAVEYAKYISEIG